MFRPIDSAARLPTPGEAYERSVLDFKKQISASERFEPAKDIAALANSGGGSIVVGAVAQGERLVRYIPLSADDASGTQRCYEEGARDRCRPAPIFAVEAIHLEGGVVVVVNVWPFIGQPVGVALKQDELTLKLKDVFVYPVRVGAHTRSILPEQMSMFVDARFRRMSIALQGFVGREIRLYGRTRGGSWLAVGELVSLDEAGNCVDLLLNFQNGKKRFALPFDLIDAVWVDKGRCKIRIPGYVDSIEWSDTTNHDEFDDEALFIEVPSGSLAQREREQRVRVTQFPHPPSLLRDIGQFIRKNLLSRRT